MCIRDRIKAILDPQFRPMALETRAFREAVANSDNPQRIAISVVRNDDYTETIYMDVFREGADDARNYAYVERIVKTMLWAYGGYKIVTVSYTHLDVYKRQIRYSALI